MLLIHLGTIDVLIILIYFIAILIVGYRAARRDAGDDEHYLLAGRSLTLPVFVMTLVSTWYGGILGVGEFSYRYGISNWVMQGLPYYVFAAVFAFVLAKKIRATNLFSIPDQLESVYGKKTALLGSVLTFILMTPAPYVLMLGVFIQMLFGWSLGISMVVVGIVAVSYLYHGGMKADIQTDKVEFVMMFVGFAVILPFCYDKFGGWEFLINHLPPLHLTWHGGHSVQYIFVWFFIALWTLVDPAFHQRCYAAKDEITAQRGILWSILFWFFFDCMTALAGLYARAGLPELSDPVTAYPMLAETVLPPVAKGVFYVGMLATMMSTLNTLAFVSAQTLGRDLIGRVKGKMPVDASGTHNIILSDRNNSSNPRISIASGLFLTKIGLIVSFVFSVILALSIPSVIRLWYVIGTVIIPGLLIPLISSYFKALRVPARYAFWAMLLGWLTSSVWLVSGLVFYPEGEHLLGIEPMMPGLLTAVMIWWAGKIQSGWTVNTARG